MIYFLIWHDYKNKYSRSRQPVQTVYCTPLSWISAYLALLSHSAGSQWFQCCLAAPKWIQWCLNVVYLHAWSFVAPGFNITASVCSVYETEVNWESLYSGCYNEKLHSKSFPEDNQFQTSIAEINQGRIYQRQCWITFSQLSHMGLPYFETKVGGLTLKIYVVFNFHWKNVWKEDIRWST